jgi:uncharacterized protein
MTSDDAADLVALAGWRRAVNELYAEVRHAPDPAAGHELWRRGRDLLFRTHPQSPLPAGDPHRESGLSYWPYDESLRFTLPVLPASHDEEPRYVPVTEGRVEMRLLGRVLVPELGFGLDVWWLAQYAGGVFVPVRDGTAGIETYGGGRYLLDTAKGADLGDDGGRLVVDLNFLYHPSCRFNPAWQCPLAPAGSTTRVPVRAGERL